MSRPLAPSMPTEKQVREAFEIVTVLCPGARIKSVGPDGVTYLYPDEINSDAHHVQPFSGDVHEQR